MLVVEAHAKLTLSDVAVTAGGGGGIAAAIGTPARWTLRAPRWQATRARVSWLSQEGRPSCANSTLREGLGVGLINDGTTNFVNSTVASNKDGGIQNKGTLNLTNTIVAENRGSDCKGKANTSDQPRLGR